MTNYIELAIKKAIEGGWNPQFYPDRESLPIFTDLSKVSEEDLISILFGKDGLLDRWGIYRILFTPLFWQALGKKLGWEENKKVKPDIAN